MRNKLLCVLSLFGLIAANAADFYVDANSTAQTPDGTQESPFASIKAAVDAANAKGAETGEDTFVYIRALGTDDDGNEIAYVFDDISDLVTVTATNMTITSWGVEKPLIELAPELGKNVYDVTENAFDPNAITLGEKIRMDEKNSDSIDLYCEVKNLKFRFYGENHDSREGQSLGTDGKVIRVIGRHCVVDSCEFQAVGVFKAKKSGRAVVGPDNGTTPEGYEAQNDRARIGAHLSVKNCFFEGIKNLAAGVICVSYYGKAHNNVFLDCDRVWWPIKQSAGGYFVSNKVVNLSKPFPSNSENYSENEDMEIAYNVFVNSDLSFFNKAYRGMNRLVVHHNTIVGYNKFINVSDTGNSKWEWTPTIYNNLIVLSGDDSVLFSEEANHILEGKTTTIKSGSSFRGNVYLAAAFAGGTAAALEGYNLENSLECVNNLEIFEVPAFIETEDVFSDDYYRLNSDRYSWSLGIDSDSGKMPEYVGALEPAALGLGLVLDSFDCSSTQLAAGHEIVFSVFYANNKGAVRIYWDFDGDGTYDEQGEELSCTYRYKKAGFYLPMVKIVDMETGVEVVKSFASQLQIGGGIIYVDSLAEASGDGSEEKPYITIRQGVEAAVNDAIVYVRGGAGREYRISSADDLITIVSPRMTLCSEAQLEPARVIVDSALNSQVENPSVITVAEGADSSTISGFEFVYYGENFEGSSGNSLGEKGTVINVLAVGTSVSDCSFYQYGSAKNIADDGDPRKSVFVIASAAAQNSGAELGKRLSVSGCRFVGVTGDKRQMKGVWCGKDAIVAENFYTNCVTMFVPLKAYGATTFSFVSNILVECNSIKTTYGSYNEWPKAEIAYNTFTTSSGEPFILKGKYGLTSDNVRIHHNTIVGSSAFIAVDKIEDASWKPQIYENLIVLSEGGVLIRENFSKPPSNRTTSFLEGAVFRNNAYFASGICGGVASELSGYNLLDMLEMADNHVLAAAPRFISIDPESSDFYRLKARKGGWSYSTSATGYPGYVGAIEPELRPEGFSINVR